MQSKVVYEKTITREALVAESRKIWSLTRAIMHLSADETFKMVRERHPQFCTSYPIVVRYMVNMNAFSPIAFEEFVKYIEKNPWKSEEEFCESQGKYIFMLYRKISPKTPLGVIYKLRGEAVDELRKESKRFKSDVERADRAAKEIAAGYDVSRREEFAAALAKYKALLLEERDQVVMDDSVEGIIAALQPQGSESPMPDAECDIKVIAAEDLLG